MHNAFLKFKNYLLGKDKNKLVYRFISEREKKAFDSKDLSQIGTFWYDLNGGSTHNYKKGKRYIHLFDKKKDAMTLHLEVGGSKQYFCTYSIPKKILKKYTGKGFYMVRGYENYSTIKEYAIPSDEFDFNWLVSIEPKEKLFNADNVK